jgi:hypothetical protein
MTFKKHGLLKFTGRYKLTLLSQELNNFPALRLLLHDMRLMLGASLEVILWLKVILFNSLG